MSTRQTALDSVATVRHMDSLLARVTPADIVEEPFPHVVFHEPLDEGLCDRLIAEFPTLEAVSGGKPYKSNELLVYHASRELEARDLSPLWREMIRTHVSQGFLEQLLALFAEPIGETYPALFEGLSNNTPRVGTRYVDNFETADVLLEAQAAINTPVTVGPSAVRGAHLDNPNKLVIGLYYLRHPEEDSSGGDLELYRYTRDEPEFHEHEIDKRLLERVKTIPYEKNTLVLFLNTVDSLHRVSVRELTPHVRQFLSCGASYGPAANR